MRHISSAALVVVLCGCGPRPFNPARQCDYRGASILIKDADGKDCTYYQAVVDDTAHALVANGIASETVVAQVFNGRVIWIRSEVSDWHDQDNRDVRGEYYNVDGSIQLTRNASSMLHEVLHALADLRGVDHADNQSHRLWGYMNAQAVTPLMHWGGTYDQGGHDELPGSWYNLSDVGDQNWRYIYQFNMPLPSSGWITAPTYNRQNNLP